MKKLFISFLVLNSLSVFAKAAYDYKCIKGDHTTYVSVKEGMVNTEFWDDHNERLSYDNFQATRVDKTKKSIDFYGRGGIVFKLYDSETLSPYLVDAVDEEMDPTWHAKIPCKKISKKD